jgi:uncharacterized protein DUF4833
LRGVRSTPLLVALVSCASCALYAVAARAGSPVPAGSSVAVFSIAKSENKNQVQYVIRVDDHCAPVGPAPVSAYWRMLEKGPAETAPILAREVRAYGLASQAVVAKDASGGQTRVVLTALPGRPLTIATSRASDGTCRALTTATIAGAPAHLFNVYVHLKWDGVDYLLLQGWSMDGSRVLRETVK